jgi:glycerol-3-phosphate dehydrogenase
MKNNNLTTDITPSSRLSLNKKKYDLIIVGGGIFGATLAWEATTRGLKTILLEKNDFACGTSANSLKMIHGGIRYLQDFNFSRMRVSIRERRAMLRIAPHLVEPLECLMPTYRELTKSRLALLLGITLYDFCAFDRNDGLDKLRYIDKGRVFPREELFNRVPKLVDKSVTGGASWFDAQAYNTERLVLSFIKSSQEKGATTLNYVEAQKYHNNENKFAGVFVQDKLTGESVYIQGNAVIECKGPWSNPVRTKKNGKQVGLAKAVNILVKKPISACAIGIKPRFNQGAKEKSRLLFIAPWRGGSIIGTWYFAQHNFSEKLLVSKKQLMQFLSEINSVFPSLELTFEDIGFVHLGLLPTEDLDGSDEPALMKSDIIAHAADSGGMQGVFQVQGVKFTTARHVSMCALNKVAKWMKQELLPSHTEEMPLYGGDINNLEDYLHYCIKTYSSYCSKEIIHRIIRNYGTKIKDIMKIVEDDPTQGDLIPGTSDSIKAELVFVLENEMAFTLSDVILRRTDIGSFKQPKDETTTYIADVMSLCKSWDATEKANNIKELLRRYDSVINNDCHRESQ